MKTYFRIVLPIFITVFVYTSLSLFFGPKGLFSTHFMETQLNSLMKNVDFLNSTGFALDGHIKNLTYDPETIAIYAHELGYIYENEGIIKLVKFNSEFGKFLNPGTALEVLKPHFLSDYVCKTVAFSFGILVIIFEMVMVKRNDYKKKRQ